MLESLKKIVKKVIGDEEAEEIEIAISASDGCKGEETIAKIMEKIRGDEPC